MVTKSSTAFKERTQLIELQHKRDVKKHANKMLELEYMRENENLKHNQEMERQRIKSAEIRKMQERKEVLQGMSRMQYE